MKVIRTREWCEKRGFNSSASAKIRAIDNVCLLGYHGKLKDIEIYEILIAIMHGLGDDPDHKLLWTMLGNAAMQTAFVGHIEEDEYE